MIPSLDPAEYLAKTNTTFLVGDTINSLVGCNTLASVHVPFPSHAGQLVGSMIMGYYSHSVDEFLDNLRSVPEKFLNGSVTHLCYRPEIQFTVADGFPIPTIHNNPSVYNRETSKPEEIMVNATWDRLIDQGIGLWLGEPISMGVTQCSTVRFDWKIGDAIQNQTYEAYPGGNITKQLLKVNDSQSISNLSFVCTSHLDYTPPRDPDSSSESFHHLTPLLAQLLAVLMATLVVILV